MATLTTWNFSWRASDLRLIPAVPDVKVRRMLEALRSDWLPSIPATEPLTVVGRGPRQDRNSAAIPSLKTICKQLIINEFNSIKSK